MGGIYNRNGSDLLLSDRRIRTAGPSAPVGMTRGRAAFTLGSRTGDGKSCCLQPRTEKTAGGSADRELIATSTKITRVDLWGAKVLKAVEA